MFAVVVGAGWLWAGPAWAAPTEPGTLTNTLQPAEDCMMCHTFANPPELADQPFVTPTAWLGGLMANSARDPVFWAGVAIADQDAPGETTDCVRCHAPRAFVAGREQSVAIDELLPDDLSGVDCDLCHRLLDDGVTPAGNARYTIDDELAPNGDIRKRGPWDYVEDPFPKHSWAADPYMGESRTCGTCHDVTTAQTRVDADGQSLNIPFGEQRTYSEWLNSSYAVAGPDFKSCQGCHMPAVDDVAGCGEFVAMGDTHPTGGRRHDLAGANRRMVEILKTIHGDAGDGTVPDDFYDLGIEAIDRTLAESATLEVTAPASVDLTAGISALDVTVTNNTGHKLPSGYSEGRVMWLEVIGRHAGAVVYASGQWVAGQGLEDDPQLRTYEAVAVEHATNTRFHLLRNNTWQVDSRIPPKGLIKNIETDPVGDRYTLQPDQTWPHFDAVSYSFPPADVVDTTPDDPADDVMDLSVRLLYVINTPEYVEFLADENVTNSAGQTVADLFSALGPFDPLVLAEWSQQVPLAGLTPPAPETTTTSTPTTSAGESGAGSADTTGSSPTTGSIPTTGPATSDPVTTSTGPDAGLEAGGGGGCACRTATPPGALLLLTLLALPRRRRLS